MLTFLKISFVLVAIGYGALLFRSNEQFIQNLFIEDSYYVMTVAQNVATGHGVTIDGTMRTNGFQPLFTALCVTAFFPEHASQFVPLRIVFTLSLLIFVGAALLFGKNIQIIHGRSASPRSAEIFWTSAFLYLSSLFLFIQFFNGLETGLTLFMINLLCFEFLTLDFERYSHQILFGASLGITVLARIDTVFLVTAFAAFHAVMFFRTGKLSALRTGVIIGVAAVAISSPWWIYNVTTFGSLMPSSGASQFGYDFSWFKISKSIDAVLENLFFFTFTLDRIANPFNMLLRLALLAVTLVIVLRNREKFLATLANCFMKTEEQRRARAFLLILSVSALCLVAWYVTFSTAAYFFRRYFVEISVVSSYIVLIVLSQSRFNRTISLVAALWSGVLILAAVGVTLFGVGLRGNQYFAAQLKLIQRDVPASEVVAAGQTGTIGYFRQHVLNVDGKVNSEVLQYHGREAEYLNKKNVMWFCDWKEICTKFLGNDPRQSHWIEVDSLEEFHLYRRIE